MVKALVYARVSSKEQEKEGYSIPAQLSLLVLGIVLGNCESVFITT